MTATELYELTKSWPVEAKPKDLEWNSGYPVVQFFNRGCEYDIGALQVVHAAALFVASGIEYLTTKRRCMKLEHISDDNDKIVAFFVVTCDRYHHEEKPTRLEAVSAAIAAIATRGEG